MTTLIYSTKSGLQTMLLLLCLCVAQVWPTTESTSSAPATTRAPPENVDDVKVTMRTETELELEWNKVSDDPSYSYTLEFSNGTRINDIVGSPDEPVKYKISGLAPGTKYDFTLFTVFENDTSSGHNFSAITRPENVNGVKVTMRTETELELQWDKVSDDPSYSYTLEYRNGNKIDDIFWTADGPVKYNVSGLAPGTKYDFTLFTVFETVRSSGCNFSAITRPANVHSVNVTMRTETELELQWNEVSNDPSYNYTLEYRDGNKIDDIFGTADGLVKYNVSGLAPGTKYDFTLFTVFENVTSSGHNFSNVTRPANVHSVNVTMRTETELELQWHKVPVDPSYSYRLEYRNGNKIDDIFGTADGPVKYNVSGLAPGTKYDFTLFTVFENVTSGGHNFSTVTRPANVHSVNVTMRTEIELELQWHKVPVDPSYSYRLEYRNGNKIDDIFGTADGPVKYNVSGLAPGTKYDFTLFTVFENVTSGGHNFSTVTRPGNVNGVNVTMRTETELELQWNKVPVDPSYSYTLVYRNGTKINDTVGPGDGPVKYRVSGLAPGTKYDFTLFTVFENVTSGGHNFSTVTTFSCSNWNITNTTAETEVYGLFSNATATNGSTKVNGKVRDSMVLFTGLFPGSSYNMSLLLHLNSETVKQCDHTLTLVPPQVTGLHCDYVARGYGFSLSWEPPQGVWTQVEVKISGRNPHNATGTEMGTVILGVKPAQTYHMTVTSVSGTMRSASVTFQCETDPRGVIAGSVMAVLLLAVVAFLIVFILRRKPELLSPKFFMESKIASDKFNYSKGQFEAHFNKMSCDQNRGFSEEYEDLSTVGKEQTCKAALISENNDKNRFSDVLPYDWSRVKLPTINNDYSSDYINACYVPGYGNNSRQYIAAQGPLPHTVNDFWRMCWEQRVHSIVMVTNCCEGGKVKCEQYWPLDYTPCVYGDILVRVSSENKVSNWTLREFEVTNRVTSSVRSVKHFHFTAWPDHGVPGGTSALIQFRGLIRQHIESCGSVGPTLVHCSAGVGRTGTLIALDVTLQQLEREKAVGLAAFVYKMRLSRPLMVQTESQYVFLHQCIMDSLRPKLEETQEEPLYENVSTIYVNATALRELNSANTNA